MWFLKKYLNSVLVKCTYSELKNKPYFMYMCITYVQFKMSKTAIILIVFTQPRYCQHTLSINTIIYVKNVVMKQHAVCTISIFPFDKLNWVRTICQRKVSPMFLLKAFRSSRVWKNLRGAKILSVSEVNFSKIFVYSVCLCEK